MTTEILWTLGPLLLTSLGALIGRLSITEQQRIVRLRQERRQWLLYNWQSELERREGTCVRCRGN